MSTSDVTRRTFAGGMAAMGAMAAAGINMGTPVVAKADEAADPALQFELEDPSTYWGENVVAPHTTRESAYANVLPELADEPMSNLNDMVQDVLPLDEIEDAVLPDGTVVPAVYVKLRNHLNRIGQGIGSTPVETSYQMIQYLWSEEDAQHEIEMPINVQFDALEYHYLSGRPVEECKEILDDLAMRGMIMRAHRSGHDVYHLLPYINGFWEFNELRAYFENGGDPDGVAERAQPRRDLVADALVRAGDQRGPADPAQRHRRQQHHRERGHRPLPAGRHRVRGEGQRHRGNEGHGLRLPHRRRPGHGAPAQGRR